jgi:DNA-binding HxlR family transcriptional regulator
MLATAPNPLVLEALAVGPTGLGELQGRGGVPGSTLRARLKDLVSAGAIVADPGRGFRQGAAKYELTDAGGELLDVVEVLACWLTESSDANRAFGGNFPKAAIGALAEGWSATLLRALAVKPLSVADLDSIIAGFNYPSLERRIAAMRHVGQVEARSANGRETPYAVTPWLRRGVAPLLAAIRWERLHLDGGASPVTGLDVETIFLLAAPLLKLAPEHGGSCRLSVELGGDGEVRLAGALAVVKDGTVASCTSRLDGGADAWASGGPGAWLRALIDGDDTSLELGGDGRLAREMVGGMHRALFGSAARDEALA